MIFSPALNFDYIMPGTSKSAKAEKSNGNKVS